jgi:cell wall-associated NlpC family hydrolase
MTSPHRSPALTRRDGLRLAAAGTAGLALASLAPATAAPSPRPAAGAGLVPGARAHVGVSATTLWVAPRTARPGTDDPALSAPVDLDAWNANMSDTESRRWLTGKLETQAVLGSEVIVDEVDGDWAHVVVTAQPTPRDERGYPGWVRTSHLVVDPDFAELADCAPTATVTALTSTLTRDAPVIPVSFDTTLPVLDGTDEEIELAFPGGVPVRLPAADVVVREPGELPPRPTVEDVIATGERFLGLRYLWAGVSAWGFDCSGYTYTLFHHHGITIARDAGDQMHRSGLAEVAREDLRRGDLVFFATEPGGDSIRHVALHLGDDQIMQAPNAARSVEVMSLSESDPTGEYAGARRVLEEG